METEWKNEWPEWKNYVEGAWNTERMNENQIAKQIYEEWANELREGGSLGKLWLRWIDETLKEKEREERERNKEQKTTYEASSVRCDGNKDSLQVIVSYNEWSWYK